MNSERTELDTLFELLQRDDIDADKRRKAFDGLAEFAPNPDALAAIEFAREYFCNPEFRDWMSQHIEEIIAAAGSPNGPANTV